MPTPPHAPTAAFFGHPRGLSTLFFTEMWERFSYYGMRGVPHPVHDGASGHRRHGARHRDGGRRSTARTPSMVYLMSLPGGWIADRLIGQRRAVLVRRHPDRLRPLLAGRARRSSTFYLGLAAHRARHRPAQAEHQRHRRAALRAERRAPRRRVLALLHGHQPRRVLRAAHHRLPRAGRALPRRLEGWGLDPNSPGTGALAPPASA